MAVLLFLCPELSLTITHVTRDEGVDNANYSDDNEEEVERDPAMSPTQFARNVMVMTTSIFDGSGDDMEKSIPGQHYTLFIMLIKISLRTLSI